MTAYYARIVNAITRLTNPPLQKIIGEWRGSTFNEEDAEPYQERVQAQALMSGSDGSVPLKNYQPEAGMENVDYIELATGRKGQVIVIALKNGATIMTQRISDENNGEQIETENTQITMPYANEDSWRRSPNGRPVRDLIDLPAFLDRAIGEATVCQAHGAINSSGMTATVGEPPQNSQTRARRLHQLLQTYLPAWEYETVQEYELSDATEPHTTRMGTMFVRVENRHEHITTIADDVRAVTYSEMALKTGDKVKYSVKTGNEISDSQAEAITGHEFGRVAALPKQIDEALGTLRVTKVISAGGIAVFELAEPADQPTADS